MDGGIKLKAIGVLGKIDRSVSECRQADSIITSLNLILQSFYCFGIKQ